MKKRRRSIKSGLSGWAGLAMKTAAMLTASAEVIATRTQRLAAAPKPLKGKDAREAQSMVAEKAEAAVEAARAVAMPLAAQTIGLLPDMLGAVTPAKQARLGRKLQANALALSHAAMSPFYTRSRANARRLRKTPK